MKSQPIQMRFNRCWVKTCPLLGVTYDLQFDKLSGNYIVEIQFYVRVILLYILLTTFQKTHAFGLLQVASI